MQINNDTETLDNVKIMSKKKHKYLYQKLNKHKALHLQ